MRLATDAMTGWSLGFGIVEMVSAETARAAITTLNGREIDGRRIRVHRAHPEQPAGGAPAQPMQVTATVTPGAALNASQRHRW